MIWPNQIKKLFAFQVQILSSVWGFILLGEMGWQNLEALYGFQNITISFVGARLEDGSNNSQSPVSSALCPLPVFQHTILVRNGLKTPQFPIH